LRSENFSSAARYRALSHPRVLKDLRYDRLETANIPMISDVERSAALPAGLLQRSAHELR
jgi:hypothetical protein